MFKRIRILKKVLNAYMNALCEYGEFLYNIEKSKIGVYEQDR